MTRIVTALVIVLTGMAAGLYAEAAASTGIDAMGAYTWRGITFNEGLVLQPWMDITAEGLLDFGDLSINVWGNYDMDDYDETLDVGEFSEVDITVSYAFSLDPVDINVGLIEYLFPTGGGGTKEIFAGASYEIMENLGIDLTIYYDYDEVKDMYMNLGVSYAYALSEELELNASLSFGYVGDDASASGDAGMHEMTVTVSASYTISDKMSAGLNLIYTDTMDEDVLPEQDVTFLAGAGISYTF